MEVKLQDSSKFSFGGIFISRELYSPANIEDIIHGIADAFIIHTHGCHIVYILRQKDFPSAYPLQDASFAVVIFLVPFFPVPGGFFLAPADDIPPASDMIGGFVLQQYILRQARERL